MPVLAEASHSDLSLAVTSAVTLLSIAATVGVFTKFIRVPYTVALVVAGLVIALSGWGPGHVRITQDLVLLLFLPPLLFQAGLHTDLAHLRRVWAPVLVMALPGVVLTSFAVAVAVRPFVSAELGTHEHSWLIALLLGVVLAPTDPISVMAAFRTAGVPEKLKTVVEGESLFNDGTAVALFTVLKGAVVGLAAGATAHGGEASEQAVSIMSVALTFLKVSGLGTIIGLALGLAAFWILKRLRDHTLETAITIALAWGSFLIAEHLHASGVIAVVVSALIMGNFGAVLSMDAETRTTLNGFWNALDFVINSVLFLLIGYELRDPQVVGEGGAWARLSDPQILGCAAAALVALAAARGAVVYPVCRVFKGYWPRGWKHVIWFAGLRGSLSLALILGLPDGPVRDTLAPIAFIVVLVSLLVQGSAMPTWIRAVRGSEPMGAGAPAP